ncbi:MAG TPA: hypothetical protein VKX49_24540 [Bryobacteraceae bacterium]|nr:hypothetical protein [Bryobacteraceae bacterium]
MKVTPRIRIALSVFAMVVLTILVGTGAFAQRASVPKQKDRLALGQSEVKQLLLMDSWKTSS